MSTRVSDDLETIVHNLQRRIAQLEAEVRSARETGIAPLKETQDALRDREQKLRIALEATGIGLWSVDLQTHELEWDAATFLIFGIDPASGSPSYAEFLEAVHPDDRAAIATVNEKCNTTGVYEELEFRVLRCDGTTRWVFAKVTIVASPDGKGLRRVGGVVDVTERRRLEEHVRETQKMEAVGALAAGVAHNFNNMLAGILPNVERAESMATPEAAVMLRIAREAAGRAGKLIRDLLAFSGGGIERRRERQSEDAKFLVGRTVDVCRTTFDPGTAIELTTTADAAYTEVDAVQIEQALLNVLINARDAVAAVDGPRAIAISVDRIDSGAEELRALGARSESSHVRIRVTDTGCGMDESTRRRMYEPFFTTKKARGTGLGLTTTYAIINEHGGVIACESTRHVGTTFSMYLPASAPPPVAAAVRTPPRICGGTERILIVDDEDLVRVSVARLLASHGYDVLEAADGEDALELLRTCHPSVDLLILDQSMPRLSGRQLLDALQTICPDKKVISFSGGLAGHVEGARAVLEKPTSSEVLLRTVRTVLDG